MKKRFLALAMSLLMTASVLAGCGGQNGSGATEAAVEQSAAGGESQAAESAADKLVSAAAAVLALAAAAYAILSKEVILPIMYGRLV